jgi:hypothetical protein
MRTHALALAHVAQASQSQSPTTQSSTTSRPEKKPLSEAARRRKRPSVALAVLLFADQLPPDLIRAARAPRGAAAEVWLGQAGPQSLRVANLAVFDWELAENK